MSVYQIAADAYRLYEEKDSETLEDLFVAELSRLSQQLEAPTLNSSPPRGLVQKFLAQFGSQLRKHTPITDATVQLIVARAIDFLADNHIITPEHEPLYHFLAALFAALVLIAVYDTYDQRAT